MTLVAWDGGEEVLHRGVGSVNQGGMPGLELITMEMVLCSVLVDGCWRGSARGEGSFLGCAHARRGLDAGLVVARGWRI